MSTETLSDELERLVREYHEAPDNSTKVEAWNLIADFTVENAEQIASLLKRSGQ